MRATMKRVRGNTLAQQVRSALAERIMSGELPPGARLKDNEVAGLFGTSNTPVREALRELEKDGLVVVRPHRGCLVRPLNPEELAEAAEVRIVLEAHAVRVATAKLSPSDLEGLAALVDAYEAAFANGDRVQVRELSDAFHQRLIAAAGNRVLAVAIEHACNCIALARHYYTESLPQPDVASYRTILEALQVRDGERAAALMADHIAHGWECIMEAMRSETATQPA